MSLVAYVSRRCNACAQFLNVLARSPNALRATDIRVVEDNPHYLLQSAELGVRHYPAVFVQDAQGKWTKHEGGAAMQVVLERY